jgi:SAM-dependent methyltransferase
MDKKVILNLGCGKTRIPDSIGVDRIKIEGFADVIHDLDIIPYPFESNSVDEIHCYHLLEHLHDPLRKMEEIYRILKPGGIIYLRVPHFSSMGAFTDITHIRPFGYTTFECFNEKNTFSFYSKARFKIVHRELKYFGLYPNTGIYANYIKNNYCVYYVRPFVRLINFFIKLSPTFFERFWCYWVGGANEVVLELEKL